MRLTIFTICVFFTGYLEAESIKTPQHVFSSLNHRMLNHPGQYPFPTDMTFRHFANHTIDQMTEFFDPDLVQKADTIYLADFYISWFIKYIHPKIKYPYILISNDSDCSHPDTGVWDYEEKWGWSPSVHAIRTLLYDPKVAAWFCKNMIISRHPKIIQIPIGQQIIYWRNPTFQEDLSFSIEQNVDKSHLLYMNMQLASHPIRPILYDLFKDKPYCLTKGSTAPLEFYHNLASSKFVLAPPGYGPDTVRFWEAIALNCIPVVEHSDLDDLYADLPTLFVYDWKEIDETLLLTEYDKIQKAKPKKDKGFFDYWANKIKAYQENIKKSPENFSAITNTQFSKQTLLSFWKICKKYTSPNDSLLCIGAIMGLRPFEIAKNTSFKTIYVQDPWGAWGHEKPTAHLSKYSQNPLLSHSANIIPISFYDSAYTICASNRSNKTHVFLDLIYRRHDIIKNLEEAYLNTTKGSLIAGSMGTDPFVQKALKKFSDNHKVKIFTNNDIWFLVK